MKYKYRVLIALLFIISTASANNENFPVGARSTAMANSAVAMSDVWSIHHNQAGLAYLKSITVGFHHENRYISNDYSLQSFAAVFPTGKGVIGVNISYLGYSKYNDSKIALAYAKSFGEKFSAGLQLDYLNTYIADNYGNKGTGVVEAGFRANPIENLFIGGHVYNPTRSKIVGISEDLNIPTILKLGMSYHFSDNFIFCAQADKDLNYNAVFRFGAEYKLNNNVFLRGGVSTNPTESHFGIGYNLKRFSTNIAFSTHRNLGITPHISLSYAF